MPACSHKKSYLKWLDKLQGTAGTAGCKEGNSSSGITQWTVIDLLDSGKVSLMTDEGEEAEVELGQGEVADAIKTAFNSGEDVKVLLDEARTCIVRVC